MSGTGKKTRTRAQHYVSQFYLRGFTNAKGKLYCYDKAADRTYALGPHSAAQEANFYEIPSTPDLTIPDNAVEAALSRMEAVWAPLHRQLIESADAGSISNELAVEYAPFLAAQWMRTKTNRDVTFEMLQKHGQTFVNDLVRLNFPESLGRVHFELNRDSITGVHVHQIFDPAMIESMSDALERHLWVIGITDEEHPFYTSDHPVVRRANCKIEWREMYGARDPGIEFAFPLDSRHLLLILEKNHFAAWKQFDNKAVRLSLEQIQDYNGLQVRRSCQRVFSAKDEFELARHVCETDPICRDPNRPRVKVESTPLIEFGEEKKNHIFVTALE